MAGAQAPARWQAAARQAVGHVENGSSCSKQWRSSTSFCGNSCSCCEGDRRQLEAAAAVPGATGGGGPRRLKRFASRCAALAPRSPECAAVRVGWKVGGLRVSFSRFHQHHATAHDRWMSAHKPHLRLPSHQSPRLLHASIDGSHTSTSPSINGSTSTSGSISADGGGGDGECRDQPQHDNLPKLSGKPLRMLAIPDLSDAEASTSSPSGGEGLGRGRPRYHHPHGGNAAGLPAGLRWSSRQAQQIRGSRQVRNGNNTHQQSWRRPGFESPSNSSPERDRYRGSSESRSSGGSDNERGQRDRERLHRVGKPRPTQHQRASLSAAAAALEEARESPASAGIVAAGSVGRINRAAPKEPRHRTAALLDQGQMNTRVAEVVTRLQRVRHRSQRNHSHVLNRSSGNGMLESGGLTGSSVMQIMEEEGPSMSKPEVEEVLRELQRRHDSQGMLEVFRWTKRQPWFRPNTKHYNSLIGFLAREGEPDAALRLFQEMLLERLQPNNYTYTALINALGRARQFDEALEVFEHMKTCDDPESRPNTVTCNVLLGALCKGGSYEEAEKIFLDMMYQRNGLGHDCRPTIVTYNTLIATLCQEGQLDAALGVLDDLSEGRLDPTVGPNIVTYNTVVDACGKAGRPAAAESLIVAMRERGMPPDSVTYTALMDAYGRAGAVDKAEEAFERMQQSGVEPDLFAYTALLTALGRAGLTSRIPPIITQMRAAGLRPNEVTYLTIIDAYGKAGCHELAEATLSDMQAAGFRPNVYTWGALIDAYGRSGHWGRAAAVFEAMQRDGGCRPNLITYAALLSAVARCETWEDALLLLYALQRSGSEREVAICRLLMGGPEEEERVWSDAVRMFDSFQNQSAAMRRSLYNTLADALWSFGLRARAGKVVDAGRERGVYSDADCVTYDSKGGVWSVDLHEHSLGSGGAFLYSWLKELRRVWQWEEEIPEAVEIITGWGRHSKRRGDPGSMSSSPLPPSSAPLHSSPLKQLVEAELEVLGGPFQPLTANPGRLVASGWAVFSWLGQEEMEQRLVLKDVTQPRPSGEMPYEGM